jgi:16S rRNA G1207 methylase RsmC
VTTTYDGPNALGRATLRPTRSRRILRAAIHFLSYHFILNRRRTTHAHVAGFRLIVRPMVFHPRYFVTSAFFARFLLKLDLRGKRVADVGTGSGILALADAQAGAASVLALDINPNAHRLQSRTLMSTASVVQSEPSGLTSSRPLRRARCLTLFCRAHPPLRANLATWPTALGTQVRTTESS